VHNGHILNYIGEKMNQIYTKKFKVLRIKTVREICFVQAMDYEHAMRLGEEEPQNWEDRNDTDYEIIAALEEE
jgi:hypothetical protein